MAQSGKPRVAFYWCASCGGCEEAVVDLAEDILGVVEAADIAFWPVALDVKRRDLEGLADGSLAAAFINGAIRTAEQEEMAHLLRRKAQLLIAFGACAHLGGVPALANLWDRAAIFRKVYEDAPSVVNEQGTRPQEVVPVDGERLTLPAFRDTVRALNQVVDVDYYLPGCPPTPKIIKEALEAILSGRLPPRGSVLAPDVALCEQCPLKDTKPEQLLLKEFRRPHEVLIDPKTCLLAQGILCLGPATRGGCEALCPRAHMPCTGCFGPTSRVVDVGAKMISAVASMVDATDPQAAEAILNTIPDPVGTFYRYSLAASRLRRRIQTPPPEAVRAQAAGG
ncbi:MAG: oxidoreductase [Armatimonadota bacterium]|nr:oxidoreductase [Armatimonadota bacterium]MDR7450492.1 oxidoreductase [Armatimonadota bacterium]MDR7466374.1 oxidoreductase [Armatimonadota bacterium]MDR7493096.1 oxidoreductase [Armatimonadota bacterium]MDR7498147.1 oxidoreductase [Armatimonadota bacterium]